MSDRLYSGASPSEITDALRPLVDFAEDGLPLQDLESLIEERLVPHLMRYDHPGFQSMFNSFPEEGASLGARIALSFNQGVTNFQVSPGGAVLEEMCCRALCDLFRLPESADATFMYSGTYANQQALYLALHRHARRSGFDLGKEGVGGFPDPERLAVLVAEDAHFSIAHAVRTLGLGEDCLIKLESDPQHRVAADLVESRIKALNGPRDIVCLVATTGTTATGAIDPLPRLAQLCRGEDIWLHVDGAYGLAYSLLPEFEDEFAGLELADSITWDPHKQLGVPIPNSLLFVRDRRSFECMAVHSDYFNRADSTEPNPGLKSPPSTRPMSALPLITSLRHQGLAGVRARLDQPIRAIRNLASHLEREPAVELCHSPQTGILCFRIRTPGSGPDDLNALQEFVYERISLSGKQSVSLARLDGRTVLRLVAVNTSATFEAMAATVESMVDLARRFPAPDGT